MMNNKKRSAMATKKAKTTYKSCIRTGEHGHKYQRNLAYVICMRLVRRNCGFNFYFEFDEAGKFDDIAFQTKREDAIDQSFYTQVKHSENFSKIEHSELFPNDDNEKRNGNFSMFKYMKSHFIFQRTNRSKKKMILYTNRILHENSELLKLVSIGTDKTEKLLDEVLGMIVPESHRTTPKHVTFIPTDKACRLFVDYFNQEFVALQDSIVNLFKTGLIPDKLSTHKCLLSRILKQTPNYISFSDGFDERNPNEGIANLFRLIKAELKVKSETVAPKNELFSTWPHVNEHLMTIKNAMVELVKTEAVPDILRDYKSALKGIIEKSEQRLCFAKSFIENSKLCTMLENGLKSLENIVITPDQMFLHDKNVNHKTLPKEEEEFQVVVDALLELVRKGTVNDVLKQYRIPLQKVLEKSEGNKYKFKESFIISGILSNKLIECLGDVGEKVITIKEKFLDDRSSKFNIPKDENKIQLLVDAIVELFRTGTIKEILKDYKSALNNIFAEPEGNETFRFAKSFYEHYELQKIPENLNQLEVTPNEMFLDKCLPEEGKELDSAVDKQLPSDCNEFEALKEAMRDLFETGTVADILKEYKVALNRILEKSTDGRKLRFKTNKNGVLCKLLENDLGNLNKVEIILPSMLFDAKNSKFKNFPSFDNGILLLKNAIKNLSKNGVVDKVLLKYQTPLQEILVKNVDGTVKFASSFNDQSENQCIRLLYELLKADSVDLNSVIKPQRPIFKTFSLPCFDSDVARVKNSLTKLFRTGYVDDVLIDYQVALKDVLQPCYKIGFSESFTETSKEFNIGLLFKKLQEDKINCSDKQLAVYVKEPILDDSTSGVRHMPFFVERTDVESFFEQFILSHSQPHDLYPFVVDELHLHMKTWMRTDIFGNLRDKDSKLAFETFEENFNKALKGGTKENENNILDELSFDGFAGQLQTEFESKYPELKTKFYTNRYVILNSPEDDVGEGDRSSKAHKKRIGKTNSPAVKMSDQQLATDLKDKFKNDKCFILTADPGMGKTMLLRHIALGMQNLDMGIVLLVPLDKIRKSLKEVTAEKVLNVLQPILSPGNFQHILDSSKKDKPITILFDAFDEIHADNRDIVIELFKVLLRAKNLRLIISGRKHIEKPLLEVCKTVDLVPVMLAICPLEKESRKYIIKSVWAGFDYQEEQFNNYSDRLLVKFEVEIPLAVELLAVLFRERFYSFCKKNAEDQKTELGELERNRFEQIKIYEMFLSTIFRTDGTLAELEETFSLFHPSVRGRLDEHTLLAIKTLDVKELNQVFKKHKNRVMYRKFCQNCFKTSDKSIIVEIVDREIKFTHQSFAEFLIAVYLFENLNDHKAVLLNIFRQNENIKKNAMMMFENLYVETKEGNDENEQMWIEDLEEVFRQCNELAFFACESRCPELVNYFLSKINIEQLKSLEGYDEMLHVATETGSFEICSFLINDYKFDVNRPKNGTPAICVAAKNGHIEIVELLLLKGAKISAQDIHSRTPLHFAAQGGHSEIVLLLIDKGADIELSDYFGETAMHYAATNGRVDVLRTLIARKATVDVQNEDGSTPLLCAAEEDHTEAVFLLIDNGADIELSDEFGKTPMHCAASNGRVDVLRTLIARNATVDVQNEEGSTPLHCAADHDHNEAVVLLLDKGADIELSDESGETAMHYAASKGRVDVLRTLIARNATVDVQNEDGSTPLLCAAEEDHNEAVLLLIDEGADIEQSDESGKTAMHCAASNGRVDVLRTLIARKTRIDVVDEHERTPLICAAEEDHSEAVLLLIDEGADIKLSDELGKTAMHYAASNGRVDVLRTLIARKALIDVEDEDGRTPLICASEEDHSEAVLLLIDEGAGIERSDELGKTAMHYAASNGRVDVLKTLIARKAKIDAQCEDGWTPLHYAAEKGHIDAVALLLDKGADIELSGKYGTTAMHVAAYNGRVDVFEALVAVKARIVKFSTSLHCAVLNGQIDAVVRLIDNGADIELLDKRGQTAMHYAASYGRGDVLRTLITKKARVDVQDEDGRTPLHYAAHIGHISVVVSLLDVGADIELADKSGKTAMHYAAANGRVDVLSALIAKNAKIDAQDENGWTPSYVAPLKYQFEVMDVLYPAKHDAASIESADDLDTLIIKKPRIDAQDQDD
ncbi:uncharacterized protein LOC134205855 [Armigeres subalbatus]|uniref:uncharacterized protein LOC134205855 n=1 Tax=Armigeres subalbatus TaxID=124917 RepID=UPI002ED320D0